MAQQIMTGDVFDGMNEDEIEEWVQTRMAAEDRADQKGSSSATGSSSSSTSSTWNKPKALSRVDIALALAGVKSQRALLDNTVRAQGGTDEQQVRNAKLLSRQYDDTEKRLTALLERIDEVEADALDERGARQFQMYTEAGNVEVSRVMDEITAYVEEEKYALRERVAERLREAQAKIAEDFPEVYDTAVRDEIYAELVDAGLLKSFEPIDF